MTYTQAVSMALGMSKRAETILDDSDVENALGKIKDSGAYAIDALKDPANRNRLITGGIGAAGLGSGAYLLTRLLDPAAKRAPIFNAAVGSLLGARIGMRNPIDFDSLGK